MVMTKACGAVLFDRLADGPDDPGIDLDQIVAAHPGLARDAGGDDHDIGVGNLGVVVGAVDYRVVVLDRRALDDIERLALRHTLDDVDERDVAELFEPGEERQGAADLPGPDQRDLVACHAHTFRLSGDARKRRASPVLPWIRRRIYAFRCLSKKATASRHSSAAGASR